MSALSEIAHDIAIGESLCPRMTVHEWQGMARSATKDAWQRAGLRITWSDAYALVDAALHHALPDRAPEIVP